MRSDNFNSYYNNIDHDFWRSLCVERGELRPYGKGEAFVEQGTVAKYIGFIKAGTLKYLAFNDEGTPSVVGLEFAGEFVADFPFSLYGIKARVSIVAETDCEIYCVPVSVINEMMQGDNNIKEIVLQSTMAVFSTVYDRYVSLYTQSAAERYNDMISRYPDIFSLFSLKDIASFLHVTPTHMSRLRKNLK